MEPVWSAVIGEYYDERKEWTMLRSWDFIRDGSGNTSTMEVGSGEVRAISNEENGIRSVRKDVTKVEYDNSK